MLKNSLKSLAKNLKNVSNAAINHSKNNPIKIVLLGLENSGKTSIFHYLKYAQGPIQPPQPTLSFNREKLVANVNKKEERGSEQKCFDVWDVSGSAINIDYFWKSHIQNSSAIVFVLDSFDTEKFDQAKKILADLCKYRESERIPILVMVNKIDRIHEKSEPAKNLSPLDSKTVVNLLNLTEISRTRMVCVQQVSTKTGYGLQNILTRIHRMINQAKTFRFKEVKVENTNPLLKNLQNNHMSPRCNSKMTSVSYDSPKNSVISTSSVGVSNFPLQTQVPKIRLNINRSNTTTNVVRKNVKFGEFKNNNASQLKRNQEKNRPITPILKESNSTPTNSYSNMSATSIPIVPPAKITTTKPLFHQINIKRPGIPTVNYDLDTISKMNLQQKIYNQKSHNNNQNTSNCQRLQTTEFHRLPNQIGKIAPKIGNRTMQNAAIRVGLPNIVSTANYVISNSGKIKEEKEEAKEEIKQNQQQKIFNKIKETKHKQDENDSIDSGKNSSIDSPSENSQSNLVKSHEIPEISNSYICALNKIVCDDLPVSELENRKKIPPRPPIRRTKSCRYASRKVINHRSGTVKSFHKFLR